MNVLQKLSSFHATLTRACAEYGVSYPVALLRSLFLYAAKAFSRKEILGYPLFVPSIAASMPVLISKERSLARLAAVNPPNLQAPTQNKDEFHRACVRHGISVPHTYGWTRNGARYDAEGASDAVIQERLCDAPSLAALSGRRGLQTMRVNTLLNADGSVSILFYVVKLLAGHTLRTTSRWGLPAT